MLRHQGVRMVLDWLCEDDIRVRCLTCTKRHYGAEEGDRHWDDRLLVCWVCGDVSNLEPVLPRFHLAWPVPAAGGVVLRGVKMVEGVPVGWLCPAHDGAVEDPIVRLKRWAGGNGGS